MSNPPDHIFVQLRRALWEGNTQFILEHADDARYYCEHYFHPNSCSEDNLISLLCRSAGAIGPIAMDDEKLNQFDITPMVRFCVEHQIIDPNKVYHHLPGQPDQKTEPRSDCLLSKCLEEYGGWPSDKKLLTYLIEITGDQVIKDYRGIYGRNMLYVLFDSSLDEDSDLFTLCYQKLIQAGCDQHHLVTYFPEDDSRKMTRNLLSEAWTPKYVEIMLELGQDPNLISQDQSSNRSENYLMNRLHLSRHEKNLKYINQLAQVVRLFCHKGFDLTYLNADGRNISDYLQQNGWLDTPVERAFDGFCLPEPTGKRYTGPFINTQPVDRDSMSDVMRLLYDHRYQKDPMKISQIYHQLVEIIEESPDGKLQLKHTDNHGSNTLAYLSWWYGTKIYDYLDARL